MMTTMYGYGSSGPAYPGGWPVHEAQFGVKRKANASEDEVADLFSGFQLAGAPQKRVRTEETRDIASAPAVYNLPLQSPLPGPLQEEDFESIHSESQVWPVQSSADGPPSPVPSHPFPPATPPETEKALIVYKPLHLPSPLGMANAVAAPGVKPASSLGSRPGLMQGPSCLERPLMLRCLLPPAALDLSGLSCEASSSLPLVSELPRSRLHRVSSCSSLPRVIPGLENGNSGGLAVIPYQGVSDSGQQMEEEEEMMDADDMDS